MEAPPGLLLPPRGLIFRVIDSRIPLEIFNVVHSLNNYNDALDVKTCLNKIHNIILRNNSIYSSLYTNINEPYKIMVIQDEEFNLH